ncbi:MAG: NAD(P)-binding protein [Mycobacterium sp.]
MVGSGGRALTAAYTAAREGLRVIIFEATDRVGGGERNDLPRRR